MSVPCFVPADILLPATSVALDPWACIAVDQFTSQPEYWERAEALAAGKPSTLHVVLPEAYLGTPQEAERMQTIRRTMQEYRKTVLTRSVHGFVYVERTQMDGTIRQGLVGAVDLEAYDYNPGSKPAIRPSEKTVVERIPPRLKVRRGAILETPHVMMLADDEKKTLIEPIGDHKDALPLLYDGELMLGGGHLRGWAVEDPALIAQINAALADLADEKKFAARWPRAAGEPPMVLAVGDGLSSAAVQANAPDCCAAIRQGLQAQGIELGPVPFIQFCRVGAGDHIGDLTDCEVICLLVGERPGLVTNESMSAYLTYRPHTGIAESCRTVVSNIHRQGVSAVEAGAHIASLIGRILAQKASGIGLREDGA